MKKFLMIISMTLVVGFVAGCGNGLKDDTSKIEQQMLERGKEILKNTYPDSYDAIEKDIVVEKVDNVWRVYNKFESIKYLEDGSMIVSFGGVYHVDFDVNTGEVIKVAVED